MANKYNFTNRELEVIQHGLKILHEEIKEIDEHEDDDLKDYLNEIKNIQNSITETMQHEILN